MLRIRNPLCPAPASKQNISPLRLLCLSLTHSLRNAFSIFIIETKAFETFKLVYDKISYLWLAMSFMNSLYLQHELFTRLINVWERTRTKNLFFWHFFYINKHRVLYDQLSGWGPIFFCQEIEVESGSGFSTPSVK